MEEWQTPDLTRKMFWAIFVLLVMFCGCQGQQLPRCTDKLQKITNPMSSACVARSSNVKSSGISENDKALILEMHNDIRGKAGATDMPKLYWDDEIAAIAQGWAETCPYKPGPKVNRHDLDGARRIPGRFFPSQNAASVGDDNDWERAVNYWYDEKKIFYYNDASKMKSVDVGHYTLMVANTVFLVGCGFAICEFSGGTRMNQYICNYGPPGNVGNQWRTPYTPGPPCDACKNNCDSTGKLCDCGQNKVCHNGGTMNVNTCSCTCKKSGMTGQVYDFYKTGDSCLVDCNSGGDPTMPCQLPLYKTAENCVKPVPSVSHECPFFCKICQDFNYGTTYQPSVQPKGSPKTTAKPGEQTTTPKSGDQTTEPKTTPKPPPTTTKQGTDSGAGRANWKTFPIATMFSVLCLVNLQT